MPPNDVESLEEVADMYFRMAYRLFVVAPRILFLGSEMARYPIMVKDGEEKPRFVHMILSEDENRSEMT